DVALLGERGVELLGPEEGDLAEGETGIGRMAEPEEIAARVRQLLTPTLHGKRVLVSAGGTREPIDAVRFVGNRASGRMGVALAEEARRRGARVTLLAANLAVPAPAGVEVVETPTAAEMLQAALDRSDADLVLMAAAPADYAPTEQRADKRPKDDATWTLDLEPATDIIRTLADRRMNGQVLIGFAADHGEEGLARARAKLENTRLDLVVYNHVSRDDIGSDAAENEQILVPVGGEEGVAKAPVRLIAAAIV